MTYSDLAGCYPIKSEHGNQYILICYDYDSNTILAEALPSRSDACINKGVQKLPGTLTTAGHKPNIHIIDNKAFDLLKKTLLKQNISYQLVTLHIHTRNTVERDIQNLKDHFIGGICSTDPKYSAHEWIYLLPQATTTLNLFQTSMKNPKLSAYAAISGIHEFNRCPLAAGTKVIFHEKTDNPQS